MLSSTNTLNAPVRSIKAMAELYNGSVLADTYNYNDFVKSIDIERIGEESKFFGFGVCQKLNIKIIDKARAKNITTDNYFKIYFKTIEADYVNNFPHFGVTEVNRDENTNELSVTAYDDIRTAAKHTVAEIELTSYTVLEFAEAIAALLGFNGVIIEGLAEGETCFSTSFPEGANFSGTETLREALNAIAEATQTVYYLNGNNELVFKRLSSGQAVLTIDKQQYITLDSSTNRRLAAITHATELGDNVTATMDITGTTQIIKDNPFMSLRADIATLLDNAIAAVGGLTINQFNVSWRGNYLLEVADKIALVTKDNNTVNSYVLNDVISYNGAFAEVTQWRFSSGESGEDSNPTTLGELLNMTYARVDKLNGLIELLTQKVTETETQFNNFKQTADETIISIGNKVTELENGEAKSVAVEGKDFTFNAEGLSVKKIAAADEVDVISTKITEDGMTVNRDDKAVLTANNEGVTAEDLHATTYLIVANKSRFEDYGEDRTGCFWVGG